MSDHPTAHGDAEEAANSAQKAYWNAGAGETWATLQDLLDRQIDPLGQVAMAALDVQAGDRVLDIGCGCGQTTLQLAALTGDRGAVTGVDISRPMLDVARRRAIGLSAVDFREADAQSDPFPAATFDRVFSRFGVMFFEEPAAAFANIRFAVKPAGRLAFVCWRPLSENPWMSAPADAVAHLLPPAPPMYAPPADAADAQIPPGPFAFADPERIRTILSASGWGDVQIQPHDALISAGDLDAQVTLAFRVGPLGTVLREHPELQPRIADAVRIAMRAFLTQAGDVRMPAACWIVTARNA